MSSPKIIILYASAGAGHRRAAEALYNEFLKTNADVTLKDSLDLTTPFFKKLYADGYEFTVKYLPWLWAAIFYMCDSKFLRPLIFSMRSFTNSLCTSKLERFLEQQCPKVVVSTQFLMSEVITRMRKRGSANFKFICVVTDFDVHSYWISDYVDEYIVSSDYTRNILISRFGISEKKIRILGIPIEPHFRFPKDRQVLARKFNIDPNKFTALIIAGTFGMGPLKKIAELLSKENQVIIGCGKNKRLFNKLDNLSKKNNNLRPVGFIDYVDELMSLSDIIITKPGGMTISESLATGLPMIFVSAIKGQETKNARFVINSGVGFLPKSINEIPSIVTELKENPAELEGIKQKIKSIARPSSSEQIVNHILEEYV